MEQQWIVTFLDKLKEGGWLSVFSQHGWELNSDTLLTPIDIQRSVDGFEDFAANGNAPVTPGEPALSLLYHGLMSPLVTHDDITYWPTLEEIDSLENYIYGAVELQPETLKCLVPVVMAYEYRTVSLTPHKVHADIVFSRTGVGRVGTHEPKYDAVRRCYDTRVVEEGVELSGTRVQAVRYGVFLCEKAFTLSSQTNLSKQVVIQGDVKEGDDKRTFWKPMTKLYDQRLCNGKPITVRFNHFHQNEKLKMMVESGKLKIGNQFNTDLPPFRYRSDRDDFVLTQDYSGSMEVWREPQELARIAQQKDDVVTFEVPKESLLSFYRFIERFIPVPFRFNNRRYTSLRVGQNLGWVMLDAFLNGVLAKIGSEKRVFLSPRRAGEFTNIRHVLDEHGEIVDLNLLPKKEQEGSEDFITKLREGKYQAVMYEDAISEGYISADISAGEHKIKEVKAAYSLMTAPDFMPRVGNIDIYEYQQNFVTGEPRALCEGRLAVNLNLRHPQTQQCVFSAKEDTVTSMVSIPRLTSAAKTSEAFLQAEETAKIGATHYLSDGSSDVFAPGWDVTYSRDSIFSAPYYHTAGLGSPFLEDVKLCAAANGMWPAASPDAARTFKRKTRTALALTDQELGLSPDSALAKEFNQSSSYGWDGEYGPYLSLSNGQVVVNYASIERSDYISNYYLGRMTFAELRTISKDEARKRLAALAKINEQMLDGTPLKDSGFWLVSFVVIEDWSNYQSAFNVPQEVMTKAGVVDQFGHNPGSGYLFVFAKYSKDSITLDPPMRREQPIDTLYFVKTVNGESDEPSQIDIVTWQAVI